MTRRFPINRFQDEHGTSLIEMAFLLPLFLLLLLGAVDFGRALYLMIEVTDAAHAAALYGSRYPTDTSGMQSAAQNDAPNVPNLNVAIPTWGCECPDGTNYSASTSCSAITCTTSTKVYRVNVKVTGTYAPIIPWPGVPSSMSLSSSASMRSSGS